MKVKRREFPAGALAGVGGLLLGCEREIALWEKTTTFDPYKMVPLGKTGIKVTRVGLGTGIRGFNRQSYHTRMGKEKFEALLHCMTSADWPTKMSRNGRIFIARLSNCELRIFYLVRFLRVD